MTENGVPNGGVTAVDIKLLLGPASEAGIVVMVSIQLKHTIAKILMVIIFTMIL